VSLPAAPIVSVVVLTRNGLDLTRECLRTLLAVDYPDLHVIVIDNGSREDEAAPVRAEFGDRVEATSTPEPLGFCRGNNLGIRRALDQGSAYVLLLNNDTTVEPDFLRPLVELMESEPRIGVAGPKILRHADPSRVDSVGGDLNLWIARHVHFHRPYAQPRTDLTFIHGCAFMLRREALEEVGLLDEDYFAYWEEGDYCMRLRRAGWRIACQPASVIYHKVAQTNRFLSNFYIYYMIRNGFLFMRKNGRWYQWPSFTFFFLVTSVAKYSAYLVLKRPRDIRIVVAAVMDFLRGRWGPQDLPLEPRSAGR
jgi:GT2 family glycosyltransferase